MSKQRTTDDIAISHEPPTPEEPATRFIDVHIYDYTPGPEAIESEPEARGSQPAYPW